MAAHEQVARAGKEEIESGRLSQTTRQREGLRPQTEGQVAPGNSQQAGKGILKSVGRDPDGRLRVVNE